MFPQLDGFDHLHVYVSDREKAATWYQNILGFKVTEAFAFWAEDPSGPLTIEDSSGSIHLALFQRDNFVASTAIAFKADGRQFLHWKTYLDEQQILLRCTDHKISWSLYFNDLDKNMHEITTYDHDFVTRHLQKNGS